MGTEATVKLSGGCACYAAAGPFATTELGIVLTVIVVIAAMWHLLR